jgi:hypothetical protein
VFVTDDVKAFKSKSKEIANMAENSGGTSTKQMVILGVLVCVLIAILAPQFIAKSKASGTRAGISKGQMPLPPNFDKMPPKLQEMILKSRERMAK